MTRCKISSLGFPKAPLSWGKEILLEDSLKGLINILLICILCSCSLKEAMDNDFETKTETKPFAPSKTLAERFGNGEEIKFTLKVPLTEDSVGYYDVEDILGNRNLDSSQKLSLIHI